MEGTAATVASTLTGGLLGGGGRGGGGGGLSSINGKTVKGSPLSSDQMLMLGMGQDAFVKDEET